MITDETLDAYLAAADEIKQEFGLFDCRVTLMRAGEDRHTAIGFWMIVKPFVEKQAAVIGALAEDGADMSERLATCKIAMREFMKAEQPQPATQTLAAPHIASDDGSRGKRM